jgi:L-fuconolactonase
MMFGSDWPVCLLAATYKQSIDLIDEFTSKFSDSEKNAFWSGTAINAYGLNLF